MLPKFRKRSANWKMQIRITVQKNLYVQRQKSKIPDRRKLKSRHFFTTAVNIACSAAVRGDDVPDQIYKCGGATRYFTHNVVIEKRV
ncbi:hypothetical protein J6590_056053 [Homalodisca vitripennis]|nr:hypothetical protein J6590_056053 [Homalodisca vitripennis]